LGEAVKGFIIEYYPLDSVCPKCESNEDVYIHDKGLKFVKRLLALNNRFACTKCNITWRRKAPYHILRLHSKKSRGSIDPPPSGNN
jgi:transposase-like protein